MKIALLGMSCPSCGRCEVHFGLERAKCSAMLGVKCVSAVCGDLRRGKDIG